MAPLTLSHGTLLCRSTPVENHCSNGSIKKCTNISGLYYRAYHDEEKRREEKGEKFFPPFKSNSFFIHLHNEIPLSFPEFKSKMCDTKICYYTAGGQLFSSAGHIRLLIDSRGPHLGQKGHDKAKKIGLRGPYVAPSCYTECVTDLG